MYNLWCRNANFIEVTPIFLRFRLLWKVTHDALLKWFGTNTPPTMVVSYHDVPYAYFVRESVSYLTLLLTPFKGIVMSMGTRDLLAIYVWSIRQSFPKNVRSKHWVLKNASCFWWVRMKLFGFNRDILSFIGMVASLWPPRTSQTQLTCS